MRTFLSFVFLTVAAAFPQSAFDVASFKVNKPGGAGLEGKTEQTIEHSPLSLTISGATLAGCIKWAWNVEDFQIAGAPGWFVSDRFDIAARTSAPASEKELRMMLRTLLAERVHLVLHTESRNLPLYELVQGKGGATLRKSVSDESATMRPMDGSLVFRNTTMSDFAGRFALRPLKLDRPVLDRTGLPGKYDFSLKFATGMGELKSALEAMDRGDSSGPSIPETVQAQLGLRLEAKKGTVEVLVIDRVERTPVAN